MKAFFLIASIFLFNQLFAQSNQVNSINKKIKFNSISQIGLLNGDGGASYDVQLINGIRKGKWAAGIGVGIDNYISRSVPLFIDLRRELFSSQPNRPFIYAGAGLNFTWLNHIQKEQKGLPYSTTPGLFVDAGLGYEVKMRNSSAFVISAGYSYKQSKEEVSPQFWIMPWPMPRPVENPDVEKLNSHFRRVAVRIGIQI